jgi:hypothetical protein
VATTTASAATRSPPAGDRGGGDGLDRGPKADRSGGQPRGELLGDRAHPAGRQRGRAPAEHEEGEVEHPARRPELGVEEDAGEQRAEEAGDHPLAEPAGAERRERRRLRAVEDVLAAGDVEAPGGDARLVGERADGGGQRGESVLGASQRVADARHPPVDADEGPRHERPEVERGVVEDAPRLGVGRQVDLEAPVEQEPVDLVGPHAPADAVGGLEHGDVDAADGELPRAGEAGQAGADDRDRRHAGLPRTSRRHASRVVWRKV